VRKVSQPEWEQLKQIGIEVKLNLLTEGEILLLKDRELLRYRCQPSRLRSVWVLTEEGKDQDKFIEGALLRRVLERILGL
jgi:hypothetical protein